MCKADTVTEPFASSTPSPFFVFLFMFFPRGLDGNQA